MMSSTTTTVAAVEAPAHTMTTVSLDRPASPAPVEPVTTTTEVIDSSIPLYSRPASSTSTAVAPNAEDEVPITPYAVAVQTANPFEGATGVAQPPPPYTPDFPAPKYSEPRTFAQDLFYFGFIFPLFWVVGALIMCISLKPVPEEICGKSLEEQAAQLEIVRKVELKWARRSLYAFCSFLFLIGTLIGALAAAHVGVFARS
jgi:hypothetical protein